MCSFCTRLIELDAAGDRNLYAIENHRTRGDGDRLQARCALAINRRPSDCYWQAGADRALARDVHHRRALLHGTAHDNVLDLARRYLRAPDRFTDHMPGHCRTFGVVQRAAISLANRGAGG